MERVNVSLEEADVEYLDGLDEPSRSAAVRRCVAEARRRRRATDVTLEARLAEAWTVLRDVGSDRGDRYSVRLGTAESRLADRLNTPKEEVRKTYLAPLRAAGVVDVVPTYDDGVFVWVAKPPEPEREEVPADA